MKKIILVILISFLLLTGCSGYNKNSIINNLDKKISDGYKLSGNLKVLNNDENYDYDVEVYYGNGYYKVEFTNTQNSHTQVILKNKDGVFVLTPALNKSFKFQSDWPYNNSQIYLLDALVNDLKNDSDMKVVNKDNNYIITSKVKYTNNPKLKKEKIILSNDLVFKKVIVYDKDNIESMVMEFNNIDYSYKYKKDDFLLDNIISKDEELVESSSLDDVIYPLYVPSGTKLVNEDKIKKDNGERVIMNYEGDKSFLLVEETADVFNEFTVIPTIGEPYFLMDSLGVATSNSLSWTSGGIDYYLVSDVMSQSEMIEVAQSINGIISMK